jgi:hypothetical protein
MIEEDKQKNNKIAELLSEQAESLKREKELVAAAAQERENSVRAITVLEQTMPQVETLVDTVSELTTGLNSNITVALENADALAHHYDGVLEKELYVNDPILNLLMSHTKEFRDSLGQIQEVLLSYSNIRRIDLGVHNDTKAN